MTDAIYAITFSPLAWWALWALAVVIGAAFVPEDDEPRIREEAARLASPTTTTDDRGGLV